MKKHLLSTILLFSCLVACKKSAGPPRPVITGFSPSKGGAGIEVTITGHFDSAITQPGVTFNGARAQVYSSSDSAIVVIVPNGVTTGKIALTLNNQSATTDSDFVVLAGGWTEKAHLPLGPNATINRGLGIGFGIGNYGYMGFGTDNGSDYSDLWRFDPASNSWTQKASLGLGMEDLISVVIGGKAYVGIGKSRDLAAYTTQFYAYDPSADTWTRKADFPGGAREGAFAFSIGGMGYVGLGWGSPSPDSPSRDYLDVWQYDPSLDVWTQKANFPVNVPTPFYLVGFSPDNQFGFVAGGEAVPAGGIDVSKVIVWRYDPASDHWTQMHNIPGPGMLFPSAMVLNGNAYVLGGGEDCWKYNETSDTWTQEAFFGYRLAGSAFAINGTGYFGMGRQRFSNLPYIDFWQFTP